MKRLLAPILPLTLLFPSLALGERMDDLAVRDGLHYKKFTEVPFTGKVTGKSQNYSIALMTAVGQLLIRELRPLPGVTRNGKPLPTSS